MNSPLISSCCKSKIVLQKPWGDFLTDSCSKCKRPIQYALVVDPREESNGVCKLYDEGLYFFTQISNTWTHVQTLLGLGYNYVGQVLEVTDTLPRRLDKYPDLISCKDHQRFSDEWRPQVLNPMFARKP